MGVCLGEFLRWIAMQSHPIQSQPVGNNINSSSSSTLHSSCQVSYSIQPTYASVSAVALRSLSGLSMNRYFIHSFSRPLLLWILNNTRDTYKLRSINYLATWTVPDSHPQSIEVTLNIIDHPHPLPLPSCSPTASCCCSIFALWPAKCQDSRLKGRTSHGLLDGQDLTWHLRNIILGL